MYTTYVYPRLKERDKKQQVYTQFERAKGQNYVVHLKKLFYNIFSLKSIQNAF